MIRVADKWFDIKKIDDQIYLITEPHVSRFARCNIWYVQGKSHDLLIDSGMGIGDLKQAIEKLVDKPLIAVATHSHFDHVGSLHQFEHRCIHSLEQQLIGHTDDFPILCADQWPENLRQTISSQGYDIPDVLIDALPNKSFNIETFRTTACIPTKVLEEGDVIDLGNKVFEILHLPGHSPGSIGLWDKSSGTLFSGDTVYDGPLLDATPDANIQLYLKTMRRLQTLSVEVVHAGHEASFGKDVLLKLIRQYINSRS